AASPRLGRGLAVRVQSFSIWIPGSTTTFCSDAPGGTQMANTLNWCQSEYDEFSSVTPQPWRSLPSGCESTIWTSLEPPLTPAPPLIAIQPFPQSTSV